MTIFFRRLSQALILSLLLLCTPSTDAFADMAGEIAHIQNEYGRLKYKVTNEQQKIDGIVKLNQFADAVQKKYPDQLKPKIWYALILATEADFRNNTSSLELAEQARDILKQAVAKDPHAMDGIAVTSLGALYYQIPGWPVSFGNNKQAEHYLNMALEVAPDSIDTNYFYGSYLVYRNRYDDAIPYFKKGLKIQPRKGLETADRGRLDELQNALKKAESYAKYQDR